MFDAFDDDFEISLVESTLDPHLEETLPLQVYLVFMAYYLKVRMVSIQERSKIWKGNLAMSNGLFNLLCPNQHLGENTSFSGDLHWV